MSSVITHEVWTDDPDGILDPIKIRGFAPTADRPDTLARARAWRDRRVRDFPADGPLLFIIKVTRELVEG